MPNSGAEVLPSRIVLDTSAYSQLRRGELRTLEAVSESEVVYIPATVLGELEAGFRLGRRYTENRRTLEDFVHEPYVEIIDTTSDVAFRYGEVFAALRRAGSPIPVNDIWIAAATLGSGAHLITFDEDFTKVDGLPHTLFRG
jgi:tRNA(fMet)-specific endonuclease VapC